MRRLPLILISMSLFSSVMIGAEIPLTLPNPGFENQLSNWSLQSSDQGMTQVTTAAARTGTYGVRVTDSSASAGSSMTSTSMAVQPWAKYTLRFWGRNVSGNGGLSIYLQFYSAQGTLLNTQQQANEILRTIPASATTWEQFSLTSDAPANAATVRVWVHSFSSSIMVADVDDFTLHQDPFSLPNPAFESGLSQWTPSDGWSGTDNMSFAVPAAARTGGYGLRITDNSSTGGSNLYSPHITVTPGDHCILRFHGRLISGSGMGIYLKFYDAQGTSLNTYEAGNEIQKSIPTTATDWTELYVDAVVPANATTVRVWLHSYSSSIVVADLDDFVLLRSKGPAATRVQQIASYIGNNPAGVGAPITNRTAWDGLPASVKTTIVNAGNGRLNQTFPVTTDAMYLLYSQTGNRSTYESPYGGRSSFLSDLALAECVENQGRFLAAIESSLNTILNERSWVMPAHDGNLDCFYGRFMIIDLGAAMRAWNIATIDYLLGNKLATATRNKIRTEVNRRVLQPYIDQIHGRSTKAHMWWHTSTNNWNSVCHAGVVGAALALMPNKNDRAWMLASMERQMPYYLSGFTPDGYCSEGIGYWNYGFGYYVYLAETVGVATNWAMNLYEPAIVAQVTSYPRRIALQPNVYPSFSDCDPNAKPSDWILRMTGRRLFELSPSNPPLVPGHGRAPLSGGSRDPVYGLAIRTFTNMSDAVGETYPDPLPIRDSFPDAGIVVCRPANGGPGPSIAIKAGHNNEHHNHNDVGSFVIALSGQTPLTDPGSEVYTQRTFSSQRYESAVLNSYGHPVPLVAGKLQNTGSAARGTLTTLSTSASEDRYRIDFKAAYSQTVPSLNTLTRELRFVRSPQPSIEIIDQVAFSSAQTFGGALITFGTAEATGSNSIAVTTSSVPVNVTISSAHGFTVDQEELDENLPGGRIAKRIGIDLSQSVTSSSISYLITPAN